MDFSSANYVKIYTDTSAQGVVLGFFGRALMTEIIKSANKAGVLSLDSTEIPDISAQVAAAIDCPHVDFVEEHLPKLIMFCAVIVLPEALVIPKYHEAQYGNRCRQAQSRSSQRKIADTQAAIDLEIIDEPAWWQARKE